MNLFNKIIYFIGILIYLAFIVGSILFFDNGRRIVGIVIFTVIVGAYYLIFIHSIKKQEDRHRLASKSILIVLYIVGAIVFGVLIKRGVSSFQDYRANIKWEKQIEKEKQINEEINKTIKDLSYNLFNDKSDLATARKDVYGNSYYLVNYIQDSYEGYASQSAIKNGKIAEPYIRTALDKITLLLNQNYGPINKNYTIEWNYYTTEDRLYGYMWILNSLINLINNQQYIKDGLDYYTITTTKDKSTDEYRMKTQYGEINWLIGLEKNMKNAEEEKSYGYIFNNFPIPNFSGNPDIVF